MNGTGPTPPEIHNAIAGVVMVYGQCIDQQRTTIGILQQQLTMTMQANKELTTKLEKVEKHAKSLEVMLAALSRHATAAKTDNDEDHDDG